MHTNTHIRLLKNPCREQRLLSQHAAPGSAPGTAPPEGAPRAPRPGDGNAAKKLSDQVYALRGRIVDVGRQTNTPSLDEEAKKLMTVYNNLVNYQNMEVKAIDAEIEKKIQEVYAAIDVAQQALRAVETASNRIQDFKSEGKDENGWTKYSFSLNASSMQTRGPIIMYSGYVSRMYQGKMTQMSMSEYTTDGCFNAPGQAVKMSNPLRLERKVVGDRCVYTLLFDPLFEPKKDASTSDLMVSNGRDDIVSLRFDQRAPLVKPDAAAVRDDLKVNTYRFNLKPWKPVPADRPVKLADVDIVAEDLSPEWFVQTVAGKIIAFKNGDPRMHFLGRDEKGNTTMGPVTIDTQFQIAVQLATVGNATLQDGATMLGGDKDYNYCRRGDCLMRYSKRTSSSEICNPAFDYAWRPAFADVIEKKAIQGDATLTANQFVKGPDGVWAKADSPWQFKNDGSGRWLMKGPTAPAWKEATPVGCAEDDPARGVLTELKQANSINSGGVGAQAKANEVSARNKEVEVWLLQNGCRARTESGSDFSKTNYEGYEPIEPTGPYRPQFKFIPKDGKWMVRWRSFEDWYEPGYKLTSDDDRAQHPVTKPIMEYLAGANKTLTRTAPLKTLPSPIKPELTLKPLVPAEPPPPPSDAEKPNDQMKDALVQEIGMKQEETMIMFEKFKASSSTKDLLLLIARMQEEVTLLRSNRGLMDDEKVLAPDGKPILGPDGNPIPNVPLIAYFKMSVENRVAECTTALQQMEPKIKELASTADEKIKAARAKVTNVLSRERQVVINCERELQAGGYFGDFKIALTNSNPYAVQREAALQLIGSMNRANEHLNTAGATTDALEKLSGVQVALNFVANANKTDANFVQELYALEQEAITVTRDVTIAIITVLVPIGAANVFRVGATATAGAGAARVSTAAAFRTGVAEGVALTSPGAVAKWQDNVKNNLMPREKANEELLKELALGGAFGGVFKGAPAAWRNNFRPGATPPPAPPGASGGPTASPPPAVRPAPRGSGPGGVEPPVAPKPAGGAGGPGPRPAGEPGGAPAPKAAPRPEPPAGKPAPPEPPVAKPAPKPVEPAPGAKPAEVAPAGGRGGPKTASNERLAAMDKQLSPANMATDIGEQVAKLEAMGLPKTAALTRSGKYAEAAAMLKQECKELKFSSSLEAAGLNHVNKAQSIQQLRVDINAELAARGMRPAGSPPPAATPPPAPPPGGAPTGTAPAGGASAAPPVKPPVVRPVEPSGAAAGAPPAAPPPPVLRPGTRPSSRPGLSEPPARAPGAQPKPAVPDALKKLADEQAALLKRYTELARTRAPRPANVQNEMDQLQDQMTKNHKILTGSAPATAPTAPPVLRPGTKPLNRPGLSEPPPARAPRAQPKPATAEELRLLADRHAILSRRYGELVNTTPKTREMVREMQVLKNDMDAISLQLNRSAGAAAPPRQPHPSSRLVAKPGHPNAPRPEPAAPAARPDARGPSKPPKPRPATTGEPAARVKLSPAQRTLGDRTEKATKAYNAKTAEHADAVRSLNELGSGAKPWAVEAARVRVNNADAAMQIAKRQMDALRNAPAHLEALGLRPGVGRAEVQRAYDLFGKRLRAESRPADVRNQDKVEKAYDALMRFVL